MIIVTFAIAMLSRKYFEEPFLALKDRFTSQRLPEKPTVLAMPEQERISA